RLLDVPDARIPVQCKAPGIHGRYQPARRIRRQATARVARLALPRLFPVVHAHLLPERGQVYGRVYAALESADNDDVPALYVPPRRDGRVVYAVLGAG